jgi:hypothetical protein
VVTRAHFPPFWRLTQPFVALPLGAVLAGIRSIPSSGRRSPRSAASRASSASSARIPRTPPGGYSGWHHHPGIVIVTVASGDVTFTNSDCSSTTYGPGLPAGSVFVEGGDDPGQASSAGGATVYATFVAPHVAPLSVLSSGSRMTRRHARNSTRL